MLPIFSPRVLELALHFAFADLALELHQAHLNEAVIHSLVAAICIVVLGAAGYIGKILLSKAGTDLHLTMTVKKKRSRGGSRRDTKKVVRKRKSA